MVRVINNNLWTPVPWGFGCGGHQCNGGNNWMQKMFGYQMLFGMMNNMSNMFRCYATPPQQQGGFYPGLYLGGGGGGAAVPQNYEEYLQQQQDAQSLTELKSAYSEFNIRKIGDRYFAYLKSDKTQRIEADSVDELMDGLNEYVDQNPDKFKTKPAARVETSDDDTDVAPAGSVGGTDGAGDPPGQAGGAGGNDSTRVRVPSTWHKRGINEQWFKTNFTDKSVSPTPIEILKVLETGGLDMSTLTNDSQVVKDMIKYNPSCFEENGTPKTPFPWNKLDIPSIDDLKNTYTLTKKVAALINKSDMPNNTTYMTNGYAYAKINNEIYMYKPVTSGNTVKYQACTKEEFMNNCPTTGCKLFPDALNKYIGGYCTTNPVKITYYGSQNTITSKEDMTKQHICRDINITIAGNEYQLDGLDYSNFIGNSSNGTCYDMLDPYTGHFHVDKNGNTSKVFSITGNGPLAKSKATINQIDGNVYLCYNGEKFLMDEVMLGKYNDKLK